MRGSPHASSIRLIWTGTFDPAFSRNQRLRAWMKKEQINYSIVRRDLWTTDRVVLARTKPFRLLLKAMYTYGVLFLRLMANPRPDIYLVSYPGWFDVPVVWLIAMLKRVPVVFDPFFSLHDTMVEDRALVGPRSVMAKLAAFMDRISLRLANVVIADTQVQADYYSSLVTSVAEKSFVLPVGADDRLFLRHKPYETQNRLVVFYGSFVPLQGLRTIVSAVGLLRESGLKFRIIGDGQDRAVLKSAIADAGTQVEWLRRVELSQLPQLIDPAALCLGIFGSSDKADRVIPHKLFECLAMGKPVITRASSAIDSLFASDEVKTVPPNDPAALARAIEILLADDQSRTKFARAGNLAYRERFREAVLSTELRSIFESTISNYGKIERTGVRS